MATRKESVEVRVTGAAEGARDLDKLGRAVDDVGDDFRDTARDASHLDRELDRLERTSRDLNREFAKSGDKGLLKQIKETNKELAPLRAVRRELDKISQAESKSRRDADSAAAARLKQMTTPGGGVRAGVGGVSLPINGTTLAIGGLAGAGLALPAFAAAGGAILAGGAAAGVAGGIAGAATSNPLIGRSAKGALQDETTRWQQASRAFEEPTLRAIKTIKAAVDEIPLEEILRNSAEFVEPLAKGVAGLVRGIGEGIGHLTEDAGPVIEVLGHELPRIGRMFEMMFDEIGQGSEGGAEALEDLLHVVEAIIIGTGKVIHFFEDVYEAGVKLRKALPGDIWQDDEVKVDGYGKAIGAAGVQFDHMADSTGDANRAAETYEQTLGRLIDGPLDLSNAAIALQASLDDLSESVKENGRQWDISTEKGRNNQSALNDAIEDAGRYRQAQIESGVATADANRQYDAAIAKLRTQAIAAGLSAGAFDALTAAARNYLSLPSVKVITTRFVTEGSRPAGIGNSGQRAFASGTPSAPRGLAWVGEDGPELVAFSGGERVFNNSRSRQLASAGGGSAGAAVRHIVELRLNDRVVKELIIDGANSRGQSVAAYLGV